MLSDEINRFSVFSIFIAVLGMPFLNGGTGFELRAVGAGIKLFISETAEFKSAFSLVDVPLSGIKADFASFTDSGKKRFASFTISAAASGETVWIH